MNILRYIRYQMFKSLAFWVIVIELIIILILYKMGLRVTYGPELEVSWNAISALGQWAGVFVGFLIPIAAVYLQSRLDKSKKDIGESNTALLKEFEVFKKEYEDKLKYLSSCFDDNGKFVVDGGMFDGHEKEKRNRKNLKNEALKFVNISMFTKTKGVAEYLDITPEEAYGILEELLKHNGLISAGGMVSKENMDTILWLKKK